MKNGSLSNSLLYSIFQFRAHNYIVFRLQPIVVMTRAIETRNENISTIAKQFALGASKRNKIARKRDNKMLRNGVQNKRKI